MARDLDQLYLTTMRALATDAVQKARSGHPGTPAAPAPVACVPWQRFLRYDPSDLAWPDRERFARLAIELQDIERFQLDACPSDEERHRRRITKTRAIEARTLQGGAT